MLRTKRLLSFVLLFMALATLSTPLLAQRYKSKTANVTFFSDAPVEDITAHTSEATGVFDADKGEFAFSVPISTFQFEKALMQEHFNENYLESDKYPKSTFVGRFTNYTKQEGSRQVTAKGKLYIHGQTQEVTINGTLNHQGNAVSMNAVFNVPLKDYKVKVPKVVFYNIAEVIEVTVQFDFEPLN